VQKLNAEINKALSVPDVRAHMAAIGVDVVISTPEQLEHKLRQDTERYAKIIKDLNIKMD
jgi:tripartite-type tricarboxylate transporter receptor subunit TctC